MKRTLFADEHEQFRASFRQFVEREMAPYLRQWEHEGIVPRDLYRTAGEAGFLGFDVPTEYGGAGTSDFRFNLIVAEEFQRAGTGGAGMGITMINDVCLPYVIEFGTADQKERWLPGMVSGDL